MTCVDCSNRPQGERPPGTHILAIGGADERLQLALGSLDAGGTPALLASQEWHAPGQAARFLAPGIKAMLDGLGLTPADLGRIAVDIGPGSFTGLRMALALAQGMAAATEARLAGLNHLELLAHEAAQAAGNAVLALAWSRRGQVYAQAFARDSALCAAQALRLDELPGLLAALPRPLLLLGGGLRRNLAHFQALAGADPALLLLPEPWDNPRPQSLLTLAARAVPAADLAPVYLRASDAEDNLEAIAAQRGLSLEQAQAILDRGSRTL